MRFAFPLAALSIFFAAFSGCSFMPWSEDKPLPTDAGPIDINWALASENPQTYFPAGVDPSGPTDAFAGEWIVDHGTGTRYFIPVKGTDTASRRQLANDALSRTSQPSVVGEVFDKTKSMGSSAAEKVSSGIDKITPEFGKKNKGGASEAIEGEPST